MTPVEIASQEQTDEDITVLYRSYNELVDRIRRSILDIKTAMQREKVSELDVFQAQINPHFLTNSMNSICCVALMHEETEIANAVSELTSFLR